MLKRAVLLCLSLTACEPVWLMGDEDERAVQAELPARLPMPATTEATDAAPRPETEQEAPADDPRDDAFTTLQVQLAFKAVDCGSCFELVASGAGGTEPYEYEWEDTTRGAFRRVCAGTSSLQVSVVAVDASGARSEAYVTNLLTDASANAACATGASAPVPQPVLCLSNPSIDGVAAINDGLTFNAPPWSSCIDRSAALSGTTNTPDIANNNLEPMIGIAPAPTHGTSYLAMSAGEQASQVLCKPLDAEQPTSVRLDAMRMDLGTSDVLNLQIWAGSSNGCTKRQLLWTSPALETRWTSYCVTLQPDESMDLLILRANAPAPQLVMNYLTVDNLEPVSACP